MFKSKLPPPLAVDLENLMKLENHDVVTRDGYILTLSRVIILKDLEPSKEDVGEKRGSPLRLPPVLLMHGLICQGSHWLLNTEEKCLRKKPYLGKFLGTIWWKIVFLSYI